MAAASSSVPFFGIREEDQYNKQQPPPPPPPPPPKQQSWSAPSSSTATQPTAAPPPKKKRNLPGNPNPDAEVIALSPKALLATNRFICEVCNKGFQREQNLQLHRRGHNLPWKLKQKNPKEVRRRVYLCPEPTCVHHDPSRALGDLTGIKKHYCRKHGEKKWKCDKCSKRYAVQSDWKAHSKTCGTREYRCDCGTLFSRRDSFITHRAFCDALAQESARLPNGMNAIGTHMYGSSSSINLGLAQLSSQLSSLQNQALPSADLLRLGASGGGVTQFDRLSASAFRPPQPPQSSPFYIGGGSSQDFSGDPQLLQNKPFHGLIQGMQANTNASCSSSAAAAAAGNLFNLSFFSNSRSTSTIDNNDNAGSQGGHLLLPDQFNNASGNNEPTTLFAGNLMSNNINMNMSSLLTSSVHNDQSVVPQMSATALLQKAAQMGATPGGGSGSSLLSGFASTYSSAGGGSKHTNFQDDFKVSGHGESSRTRVGNENHFQNLMNSLANGSSGIFSGGSEQETGLGGFNPGLCDMDEANLQRNLSSGGMGAADRLTRDFLGVGSVMRSMGGGLRQREQQLGVAMGALDSEMKSGSCTLPLGDGSLRSTRNNP